MDLLKLFNPNYLFASVPGSDFHWRFLAYGFFVLLFATSFWVHTRLAKRPHAKVEASFFKGIPYRMREFAIIGLLFTFFRDQNVPYLGMRFFLLLITLALPAYAIAVYRNYKKNFHLRLVQVSERKVVDKYRPQAKRKR